MQWFNNLKIRSKFMICFTIMAVIAGGVAFVGIFNLRSIITADTQQYNFMVVPLGDLHDLSVSYQNVRVYLREIVLSDSDADIELATGKLKGWQQDVSKYGNKFSKTILTETLKNKYATFEEEWSNFSPIIDHIVELAKANKDEEALGYIKSQLPAAKAVQASLDALKKVKLEFADTLAKNNQTMGNRAITTMVVFLLVAVGLAMGMGMFLAKVIGNPLVNLSTSAGKMAAGDLTVEFESATKDEIGNLGAALGDMATNLRKMFKEIATGVQTLASSSTELSSISEEMTAGATETADRANTVATASEEMSVNTASVAAGMEQATNNLNTVATATEEMTATIGEIAGNAEKARSITGEATQQADKVSVMMQDLGSAAQEIGKVTETITSISAQTNLLALNATIEAARAGAAGKGFAVVANEIKELAQQTAAATEDIRAKISGIQNSTSGTIADIEKIAGVIRDVSDIVSTIAGAIEEQSVVTKDIAGNIGQASMGVRDANERVAQSAAVSQSIASDITNVNSAAAGISSSSNQVQMSAEELSRLAEHLRTMVDRFKVENEREQRGWGSGVEVQQNDNWRKAA